MNVEKKVRNSNLEILRIISMLLIVAHHYAVHGFGGIDYSVNKYIIDILSCGGKLGVNCFILISGYFMINSRFTIKKLLTIIGEVCFYSISILLLFLFILTPVETISISNILKSVLPITFGCYWFVTTYIILMILTPFINEFIKRVESRVLLKLILILVIIWSVIPTLIGERFCFNNLGWFILLYLIAGYVRQNSSNIRGKASKYFIIAGTFGGVLLISIVILNFLGNLVNKQVILDNSRYFSKMNSIIVLIISIGLFIGFLNVKELKSRIINIIASTTFGIYLIHDNYLLRPYIWKVIFKNEHMINSVYLPLHAIMAILIVFIACMTIDFIRKNTIEKVYKHLLDKYLEQILERTKKVYVFLKTKTVSISTKNI